MDIGYERIEEGAKNAFMIYEPIYTPSSILLLFFSCWRRSWVSSAEVYEIIPLNRGAFLLPLSL